MLSLKLELLVHRPLQFFYAINELGILKSSTRLPLKNLRKLVKTTDSHHI